MSDLQRWLQWTESQTFERKSCFERRPEGVRRLPPRTVAHGVAESLCAMANADGGVILVGQENVRAGGEDGPGDVTGADYSPDALALLREVPRRLLLPPLDEAEVREEEHEGRRLLILRTRSSSVAHRLTDGRCLLRIGTRDEPVSEQVVAQLKQAQSPYERLLVPRATLEDLAPDALGWFAERVRWAGSHAEMLRAYDLLDGRQLNRAALLLFASRPRRWHDHPDVTIVRYSGTERGLGQHYQALAPIRVERPLVRQVEEVHGTLRQHLHKRVELRDLYFDEQLEYPEFAWQEAVVNAIAHRDYTLTGAGIEIWLFDDRMEVRSPGLPPSPITIEELLSLRGAHFSRNPLIARALTDCGLMREQGEGIPRMFREMEEADLRPPELGAEAFRFALTLRNTPVYDLETRQWLRQFAELNLSRDQRRVLALARSRGGTLTSREVQKQFRMDLYAASNLIKSLIRKRALRLPEKGGRVYEVVDGGSRQVIPKKLVPLLPAFREQGSLPTRSLARIWGVKADRAYRDARILADAGWLEPEGRGRAATYRLVRSVEIPEVSE